MSMQPLEFDVIVVGSGAGAKIARPAAQLGLRVAYIEESAWGGTCLNKGCIPSKNLIHPADILSDFQHALNHFPLLTTHSTTQSGWHPRDGLPVRIDHQKLVERVTASTLTSSAAIHAMLKTIPNLTLYSGHCEFESNKVVRVDCHDNVSVRVTAETVVVVSGCRPRIPPIPGLAGTPCLTYEQALRLPTNPARMLVIGGGYIAAELGYYYGMTGSKVEFAVRSGSMLSAEDVDIRRAFSHRFSESHCVYWWTSVKRVEYRSKDGVFCVTMVEQRPDGQHSVPTECVREYDAVLLATGVIPNTDTLGLPQSTSIELDDNGYIKVSGRFETSVEGVYAFGDVIGRHLYRHTANFEGQWVFENIIRRMLDAKNDNSGEKESVRYPPIPHAVFTNPQVAGVGMTEDEAKQSLLHSTSDASNKNIIIVGKCVYGDVAMGGAMQCSEDDERDGFMKLIFLGTNSRKSLRLVGAHALGRDACALAHMAIAYMKMDASLVDVLDTIFIHPSLSEVIRDAARNAAASIVVTN